MGAQQSMRWETGCVGEVGGGEVPKIGRKAGSARWGLVCWQTSPQVPFSLPKSVNRACQSVNRTCQSCESAFPYARKGWIAVNLWQGWLCPRGLTAGFEILQRTASLHYRPSKSRASQQHQDISCEFSTFLLSPSRCYQTVVQFGWLE